MTSATHNHAGVEVTQTLTLQESVVRVGLAKRALAMELTESCQAGRDSRAQERLGVTAAGRAGLLAPASHGERPGMWPDVL